MKGPAGEDPRLHLVFLSQAMLLVKRQSSDWRLLQAEFFDYKTSLGPYGLSDVLEQLIEDWPDAYARREEIRAFVASESSVLSL
jgi:hypothetical protein